MDTDLNRYLKNWMDTNLHVNTDTESNLMKSKSRTTIIRVHTNPDILLYYTLNIET